MTSALVAAVVLLWIVVVALAAVVFALTRQIGVLYERVAPAGALMIGRGVVVGEEAPVVRAARLTGETEMVGAGGPDGRATLVFFLSPACPVCKTLVPALRTMAKAELARLRILLAGDGDEAEHREFVRREALGDFPMVLSTQLAMSWQVGKLPYAVLVDAAGVVRAHGIVNTREHLESLVEALELGVASIQDYARREDAARGHDHPAHEHAHSHEHVHEQGAAAGRAKVA